MTVVAACQLPYVDGDIPRSVGLVLEYGGQAAAEGADLVCFPECFLQGYLFDDVDVRSRALDLRSASFAEVLGHLRALAPVVVLGLIEADAGQLYNTAVVVHGGVLLGRYRKAHLLAGEAIFQPGEEQPLFQAAGRIFGVHICNDLNFPEGVATVAAAGARLLVAPCNNMMGRAAAETWRRKHNQIRADRASESGLWILSADVCGTWRDRVSYGPTALIDPSGKVVAQVPLGEPGILSYELADALGDGS